MSINGKLTALRLKSGDRFGRLTVIKRVGTTTTGYSIWDCRCACGNTTIVIGNSLTSGNTTSCGCLQREATIKARTTHGMCGTRLYNIYTNMKQRCNNTTSSNYPHYGGRGITICPAWMNDFMSFYNWSVEHGYTEGLSIDRIDNDKGYSPDNCRWTTRCVQANNRSTSVKDSSDPYCIKLHEKEMRCRELEEFSEYLYSHMKLNK